MEYNSTKWRVFWSPIPQNGVIFEIKHLRTQDGREVDLLVETQHRYYAFEIKMANRVSPIDAHHINGIEEILDKPLLHSFILSNNTDTHHLSPNIIAINATLE